MPIYTAVTGLTSLTFFLTGLFVYSRNPKRPLYQRCFIFSTSVALWALGYFVTLFAVSNYSFNIVASRLSHAFGAFIPIVYLDFVWAILRKKRQKAFFVISYLISAVMFILCLTPLVVKTLLPKMGIAYYPEWGVLYPIYSSLFLIFPGYAQYEMAGAIRRAKRTERIRLICFFVALALAFAGGISLFLLIFNVPFPPYFSVLIILYPPMMAYTILFFRFLDIEVIIKKTLVFAGLFAMVMAVVAAVTTLTQGLIGRFFRVTPMVSTGISVLVAIVLYDPMRKLLVQATYRYLFQKKEDIKTILNRLAQNVITILDIEKVGETIL